MSNDEEFEFPKKYLGEEMEFRDYVNEPWIRGKLIGYRSEDLNRFQYENKSYFRFCRPIKQPTYKPYTLETLPWPLSFRGKRSGNLYHASRACGYGVSCGEDLFEFIDLLNDCEHLDGSPMGVKDE